VHDVFQPIFLLGVVARPRSFALKMVVDLQPNSHPIGDLRPPNGTVEAHVDAERDWCVWFLLVCTT
jgi:hypothetical protein